VLWKSSQAALTVCQALPAERKNNGRGVLQR
jgi:hypothetical protein